MTALNRRSVLLMLCVGWLGLAHPAHSAHITPIDPSLLAAVASTSRDAQFVARDKARHPAEELSFFGVTPQMTVVELWPGGGYWTEILGPYLAERGTYYVALPPGPKDQSPSTRERWQQRLVADPKRYGKPILSTLGTEAIDLAPEGSADMVLTFRNIHNWMGAGQIDAVLQAIYRTLKPGGILGVEEHRGRNDQVQDPKGENGYVRQDYMIALARRAGFELVATSELLANPKDTKDWPDGVWTLPPTLSRGDVNRDAYVAIGEADNFVLKFRKPAHPKARHGHHSP
jgi:predicted methyltransferase